MPTNPNQPAIDEAYQRGVEEGKKEPIMITVIRGVTDIFVPESWKSDEQKAIDRGREDAQKGKA